MSDQDLQWRTLFRQKRIDISHIDSYLPLHITSKDINDTKNILGSKAKDARLLAKIDNREALPEIFKDRGLFLLPIKNGEFLIIKGEGFYNIENLSATVNDFQSNLEFDLLSSKIGDSEMQHLDYSFNSGLLSHHYNSGTLYQTIRGRKYTPTFSFLFGGHTLNVDGVQIEVDGGYESESILSLIEAKNIKANNFVIRQLYYPYRTWQHYISTKEIRLSFFSHNNGVYTLHDFSFTDPKNYNSIRQLGTSHYRIVSFKKINSFKFPQTPSGENIIPQADDLSKVIELVKNINKGITDSQAMADEMKFERRQSSYYREAAEALGLVYLENNKYYLTEAGKTFVTKGKEEKNIFLAKQIINIPIFYSIFTKLVDEKLSINKQRIAALIIETSHLNQTTANRRSSTILSWLTWFGKNIGILTVADNTIKLK